MRRIIWQGNAHFEIRKQLTSAYLELKDWSVIRSLISGLTRTMQSQSIDVNF
ncbi:hypothetical protein GALL_193400 [mine drainage metagenome]|uniref:Uncharacterized protein n=1 Tax=mine drainage metagenome TaxID=410659 RepID=A0A1J5RSM9_9ZZZZ